MSHPANVNPVFGSTSGANLSRATALYGFTYTVFSFSVVLPFIKPLSSVENLTVIYPGCSVVSTSGSASYSAVTVISLSIGVVSSLSHLVNFQPVSAVTVGFSRLAIVFNGSALGFT